MILEHVHVEFCKGLMNNYFASNDIAVEVAVVDRKDPKMMRLQRLESRL